MDPDSHKTSPLIFEAEETDDAIVPVKFIGGFDAFKANVKATIDMNNLPVILPPPGYIPPVIDF